MITNTNPLKPKKKRKYKGKEIERPETDRERKERHFAGYDDLKRLSIGIPETNNPPEEEETCLIDDEINDDPEEGETDCLIPLKWAELASSNTQTQNKIRQTIQEARDKSKEKKNCEAGNPWRDENGRLTSPDKATSWSIGNKKGVGSSDCKYGKKKKSGSGRSTSWTKRECGREDVEDPNIKAKYKCKDGSVVKEDTLDNTNTLDVIDRAWIETTESVFREKISDRLQRIQDREPYFLKYLAFLLQPLLDLEEKGEEYISEKIKKDRHKGMSREQIRTLCSASGFFGWTDFLLKLSAIEQAKKGSINQNQKQ